MIINLKYEMNTGGVCLRQHPPPDQKKGAIVGLRTYGVITPFFCRSPLTACKFAAASALEVIFG
jgi:hypothetical protein